MARINKAKVTQAIEDEYGAKVFTRPFRAPVERVREGDLVVYELEDGEVETFMVEETAETEKGAILLLFEGGIHFREALPGIPVDVARRR